MLFCLLYTLLSVYILGLNSKVFILDISIDSDNGDAGSNEGTIRLVGAEKAIFKKHGKAAHNRAAKTLSSQKAQEGLIRHP